MKKILLSLACFAFLMAFSGTVSATTITVDDDGPADYTTIQTAVDAATNGDTIQVYAGTYNENVDVNKSVNIVGAGADVTTVQAASSSDHVFEVTANSVNISGFTATGATAAGWPHFAGIYLSGMTYGHISNNTASNNIYGIYLKDSSNYNTIANNTASSNNKHGIYLRDSSNYNTITNNIVSNNIYGIYLRDSSNYNTITNNIVSNNRQGIYLIYSSNNTLNNNNASNNHFGIVLWEGSSNTVANNTINMNMRGIDIYSDWASPSRHLLIGDNYINGSRQGILMEGFNENITIKNNTITNIVYEAIEINDWDEDHPRDIYIYDNTIINSRYGIRFYWYSYEIYNLNIVGNYIERSSWACIDLEDLYGFNISNNTLTDCGSYGIALYWLGTGYNYYIHNNYITGASNGLSFYGSPAPPVNIYDNYFNNTNNVVSWRELYANDWNTTKTASTNIVGGPYLGGNFWAYPNGTGFSETCTDVDSDGICDSSYTLASGNVDYLPLAVYVFPDSDSDGIFDEVDTEPAAFSDDFSDVSTGGMTSGTITTRGDQTLTITEEPNPAGVRIAADPSGGPAEATVSVCGGMAILSFSAGDEVVVTCSSVTIEVISGTVGITFVAADGTLATVNLGAGNSLMFDLAAFTITAGQDNSDTVVLTIDGETIYLAPGETAEFGGLLPMDLKSDAIAELEALKTGDKKADKEIDKAIEHVEKSLDANLWVDETRLDPKHGHKVFDEEKKAVKELMKMLNDQTIAGDIQAVIDNLVNADDLLAETAVDDAKNTPVADPKNQDKVDREIAKAEEELTKAKDKLNEGEPDKAIDHNKKAWEHAQKAIKHAEKTKDN